MDQPLDIDASIERVLRLPAIQAALTRPSIQIGENRLRAELRASAEFIQSELSGEVRAHLQAQQAVDDILAKYAKRSAWYEGTSISSISCLGLLVLVTGISASLGLISLSWFLGQIGDFPALNSLNVTAALILLLVIGLIVADARLRRINRRIEKRRDADQELADNQQRLAEAAKKIDERLDYVILGNANDVISREGTPFFQARLLLEPDSAPDSVISEPSGLTEVANASHEAPMEAKVALLRLLNAQSGASIGISGPRGAGKSTLLRSLTAGNLPVKGKNAITGYTAAPVDYDARDFLLHLFATLCRQVLITRGLSEERQRAIAKAREHRDAIMGEPRTMAIVAFLLALAGFIAVSFGLAAALISSQRPEAPFTKALNLQPGNLLLFGAVAFVTGVILTWFVISMRRSGHFFGMQTPAPGETLTPEEEGDPLIKRSLEELEDIRFQRSFTSGWSGAIKIPVGLDVGTSRTTSLAQRQESLPELVERFRSYVKNVADEHGAVVIAIDELDKMKDPADAEEFVNEIKSIFGIEGCFYLVSVSEDAMSSFERRGLALRDAFDSAFDEIKYMDYVNLDGARRILQRRISNLPDPFLCLCFLLSGGLPRDLIRVARAMFQLIEADNPLPADLRTIAAALIRQEALAKVRASNTAARVLAVEPETSALLTTLAGLAEPLDATALEGLAGKLAWTNRDVPPSDDVISRLAKLAAVQNELSAYLKYLAAVSSLADQLESHAGWDRATSKGHVDRLAFARQGLEANVGAGLSRLNLAQAALGNAA